MGTTGSAARSESAAAVAPSESSGSAFPSSVAGAGALVVLPLLGLVSARSLQRESDDEFWGGRLTPSHVGLVVVTAAIPPAVRMGAVWAEGQFPDAGPVAVGAPFYLLLVVGLPVAAAVFGRTIPAEDGFTGAIVGMGAGVLADYASLGIGSIPFDALTTRAVLLVALGLIAAGGTRWADSWLRRNRYRLLGGGIWLAGVLTPIVG